MTICETPKTPQKFNFQVATLFIHFYESKCKHYSPLSKHQHISKNFALNSINGKQMKIIWHLPKLYSHFGSWSIIKISVAYMLWWNPSKFQIPQLKISPQAKHCDEIQHDHIRNIVPPSNALLRSCKKPHFRQNLFNHMIH